MRISDWSSDVCSSDLEFLREGAAIEDFKRPDRIVVGTTSEQARAVMTALYRPLYLNRSPLLFTARRTAELIKYAANAFLAVKITFINEIADLRSEEHTSELQSLMRISYAVFCLKKKNTHRTHMQQQ